MFSVCPECKTVFDISAGHLTAAAGRVRCGECQAVFHAAETVSDTLDEARERIALPVNTKEATQVESRRFRSDIDFYANPSSSFRSEQKRETLQSYWAMEDEVIPQKKRDKRVVNRFLAAGLMASVLAAGYIWSQSARLSTNPASRAWLEPFCQLTRCTLPARQDLQRYKIVTLQVTDNLRVKDTLLLTLVFKNTADFVQPFPNLRVAFSDKSGDEISVRQFKPQEYLSDDNERLSGFPPGAKKRLLFEFPDPGVKAVSYQLDFLK